MSRIRKISDPWSDIRAPQIAKAHPVEEAVELIGTEMSLAIMGSSKIACTKGSHHREWRPSERFLITARSERALAGDSGDRRRLRLALRKLGPRRSPLSRRCARTGSGESDAARVLEGRAVQDVWIMPDAASAVPIRIRDEHVWHHAALVGLVESDRGESRGPTP